MRPFRPAIFVALFGAVAQIAAAQTPPQQAGRGAPPPQGQPQNQAPRPPLTTDGLIVGRVVDAATGRPVPGALVTLNGATPPPTQLPAAPGQRPTSMPTPPRPRFLTDGDGRFAFRYLVRGVYQLTASKPGYAEGGYGRTRPNGNTRSIQLRDRERLGDINVRLFKNGSISGTVRDEAGDPVVGLQVRLYRRTLIAGRRMLQPANTGGDLTTDDRGMYRIRDLVPGDYVVSVPLVRTSMPADFGMNGRVATAFEQTAYTPGSGGVNYGSGGTPVGADTRFVLSRANGGIESLNPTTTSGKLLGYATQYFPSSTTVARADVVTVASGEERNGVDFVLRPQPMVSISGQLFVASGDAANYMLHLVPTDTGEMSIDPDMASAVTDSTGAFVFLAVPAGQYVIQTVKVPRQGPPPPPPPPPPPMPAPGSGALPALPAIPAPPVPVTNSSPAALETLLWTATAITVGETDLHGVALTMHEGMKISGRIEFDGTADRPPAQQLARIPVTVESADGRQRANYYPPPGRIDVDGKFTTQGFLPGKYFLRIGGSPGGWTLKSAMLNGVDVADIPFELTSKDIANVVVTFTDRISQLSGTVRQIGASSDLQDTTVIVFPADIQGWTNFGFNSRRMRSTRPAQNGSFGLGTLPAGDYYAIAIPDERSAEWQDPKFLETLARGAMRFTLGEGEKRTIDLQVQEVREPAPQEEAPGTGVERRRQPRPRLVSERQDPRPRLQQEPSGTAGGPFVPDDDDQVRDPGVQPPTGSGSITGRVVSDDGSNQAVRKVRVSARGVDTRVERVAFTDAEGRYSLTTLPPGRYYVSASKPSYLSLTYGQRRPGRGIGTPVVLAKEKPTVDLQFRLPKGSVITGTVYDHYGAPLANVRVGLRQWITRDGERMLTTAGGVGGTTDDRGAYRIYGVQPGSYLVVITPPNPGTNAETRMLSDEEMRQAIMDLQAPRTTALSESPLASPIQGAGPAPTQTVTIPPPPPGPWPQAPESGRGVGFSQIYYPGTPIDTEAVAVTVAQGQELPGVDVTLRLVPTSRIDGRVLAPDGSVAQRASVSLMTIVANSTSSTSVQFRPDGTFQGTNIAPGKYTLTARLQVAMPPPPDAPPGATGGFSTGTQFGWQDIVVNGEDLTGITIATSEGQTISGRIAFSGKTAPPEWKNVRVSVEPMGPNRNMTPAPRAPQVEADGTFVMKGVMPGRYRLSAGLTIQTPPVANPSGVFVPVPPAWAVRSSTIGGRDTYEAAFEVHPGQDLQNAVITFTDQVTELSGTILDAANAPVGGLTILLFPTDRTQWTTSSSRRMRQTGSQDGKFRWYGLLPGEYFLAVVTELEPSDWGDPAYMEALAAASLKITVSEGEKKVQDLRAGG